MQQHSISFVDDEALTEGREFMFIGTPDGGGLIFYKESALSPASLEDSWAAYRALGGREGPLPRHLRSVV